MDLSTKDIIDGFRRRQCAQPNASFWCPGIGWEELNEWSGSNALKGTPAELAMTETTGRYRRMLTSASTEAGLKDGRNAPMTETAATLHNTVTEVYTWVRDDIRTGYYNFSEKIERPRLDLSRPTRGVVTQVQCTSIPKFQLTQNQSLETSDFGFNWTIPVSIWNASGSGPSSTVNFTWIDIHDTAQKSIGVLITLPQAFQNKSGVDILKDSTLRQEAVICPFAVVTRWAPVNMAWDVNATDVVPSNLTKTTLPELGQVWDDNDLAKIYGASGPIRIGVEWANMLNFDSRLVKTGTGQSVNASSIEALFWRHISQWHRVGDGLPIWTWNRLEWESPSHIQADNESWDGASLERLAARILSLVVSDGISRSADWVDFAVVDSDSNPPPAVYPMTVSISRYGWGYGTMSGVTVFAVCVLLAHAIMVLVYAGYLTCLAIRHEPVTYKMLTDVGELVVMSLVSRPTTQLVAGMGLPWNTTLRVREREDDRLELVSGVDVGHLPEAEKPYWRVSSGDFWKLPGSLRRRIFRNT
ncbi:hypothetical protein PG984_005526 [Apiospora sp. TS-2023a]